MTKKLVERKDLNKLASLFVHHYLSNTAETELKADDQLNLYIFSHNKNVKLV